MIGDMKLVALDPVYMDDLQLYPDVKRQQVTVCLSLVNTTGKPFTGKALLEVTGHGLEVKKEMEVASTDSIHQFGNNIGIGQEDEVVG